SELSKMRQLSATHSLEPFDTQRLTKDGRVLDISLTATALLDEAGQMYAIATTERACASPATQAAANTTP
ncbi:MAG: hypothetical protein PHH58_12965, partial [Rhodoferax sp.]|nr:hypothetical protein [Rhodoferax sp.]